MSVRSKVTPIGNDDNLTSPTQSSRKNSINTSRTLLPPLNTDTAKNRVTFSSNNTTTKMSQTSIKKSSSGMTGTGKTTVVSVIPKEYAEKKPALRGIYVIDVDDDDALEDGKDVVRVGCDVQNHHPCDYA